MRAFAASLILFVTLLTFAACGDEDLEFGDQQDTPTPGATSTPDDTTTPTTTPTATPTP